MQYSWRMSLAAVAAIGAMMAGAQAQDYPGRGKPITLIVPFSAGGVTDTSARMMAAALEKELQTPVQVANKVGANSQVGLTELVRAAPDGYTLSYATLPTAATHYLDASRGAIFTRKDFQPIGLHHFAAQMLAVRTDSPYRTLKDFVEAARAKPETLKISDSGLMGAPHSLVLMLQMASNAKFASVHFPGGAQSVTALLGGHVDAVSGATADARAHMLSGAFRVLGVASEKPDKYLPGVPTIKQEGYDVLAGSWTGLVGPAGLPPKVLETLTTAMKKILQDPEHVKKLEEFGVEPMYLDPAAYARLWVDIEARVKPLIEAVAQEKK